MGFLDELSVALDRGVVTVDRKSREFQLKNELGKLSSEKNHIAEQIGRAMLSQENLRVVAAGYFPDLVQKVQDIERREMEVQAAIASLTVPIAVPASAGKRCVGCGSVNPTEYLFCASCGSKLPDQAPAPSVAKTYCPSCGFANMQGARFCEQCGQALPQAVTKVENTPVAPVAIEPQSSTVEVATLLVEPSNAASVSTFDMSSLGADSTQPAVVDAVVPQDDMGESEQTPLQPSAGLKGAAAFYPAGADSTITLEKPW